MANQIHFAIIDLFLLPIKLNCIYMWLVMCVIVFIRAKIIRSISFILHVVHSIRIQGDRALALVSEPETLYACRLIANDILIEVSNRKFMGNGSNDFLV